MTRTDSLTHIADVLAAVGAVEAVLFAGLYGSRSAWRSTPAGRAVMYLVLAIGSVLCVVVSSLLFGLDYPGRPFVRCFIYGSLVVTLALLLRTLLRQQRRHTTRAPLDRRDPLRPR